MGFIIFCLSLCLFLKNSLQSFSFYLYQREWLSLFIYDLLNPYFFLFILVILLLFIAFKSSLILRFLDALSKEKQASSFFVSLIYFIFVLYYLSSFLDTANELLGITKLSFSQFSLPNSFYYEEFIRTSPISPKLLVYNILIIFAGVLQGYFLFWYKNILASFGKIIIFCIIAFKVCKFVL